MWCGYCVQFIAVWGNSCEMNSKNDAAYYTGALNFFSKEIPFLDLVTTPIKNSNLNNTTTFFWYVTTRSLIEFYRHLGGTWSQSSTLEMVATRPPKRLFSSTSSDGGTTHTTAFFSQRCKVLNRVIFNKAFEVYIL
jgi:hypothetical protein